MSAKSCTSQAHWSDCALRTKSHCSHAKNKLFVPSQEGVCVGCGSWGLDVALCMCTHVGVCWEASQAKMSYFPTPLCKPAFIQWVSAYASSVSGRNLKRRKIPRQLTLTNHNSITQYYCTAVCLNSSHTLPPKSLKLSHKFSWTCRYGAKLQKENHLPKSTVISRQGKIWTRAVFLNHWYRYHWWYLRWNLLVFMEYLPPSSNSGNTRKHTVVGEVGSLDQWAKHQSIPSYCIYPVPLTGVWHV